MNFKALRGFGLLLGECIFMYVMLWPSRACFYYVKPNDKFTAYANVCRHFSSHYTLHSFSTPSLSLSLELSLPISLHFTLSFSIPSLSPTPLLSSSSSLCPPPPSPPPFFHLSPSLVVFFTETSSLSSLYSVPSLPPIHSISHLGGQSLLTSRFLPTTLLEKTEYLQILYSCGLTLDLMQASRVPSVDNCIAVYTSVQILTLHTQYVH